VELKLIKDYPSEGFSILLLEGRPERTRWCFRCGTELGELKHKILQMEIIKERFHQVFLCKNKEDVRVVMA